MDPRQIRTVFLDYDGTLHNSMRVYAPAFREAYRYLVEEYGFEDKEWKDEDIEKFLGLTPKEMWDIFGRDIPEAIKSAASKRLSNAMDRFIREGRPELFEGALETLDTLNSRGYDLVFISNCKDYYMRAHNELFGLDRYFTRMVCSETYEGIEEKYKVLELTKRDFKDDMVIVGDRHHDIEAGRYNGIHTIGARYGFGDDEELSVADMRIDDIRELKDIL